MKKVLTLMAALAVLCSCTKEVEDNIFCTVTMHVSLPDGRPIVSMEIDPSVPGNMFRNLNTGIDYPLPVFVNNVCTIQVQKGVYMLAFDAQAMLLDGSTCKVRFTAWKNPINAVSLLKDTETLELELKEMK